MSDLIHDQLARPLFGEASLISAAGLAVAGIALLWPVRLVLIRWVVDLLVRLDRQHRCHPQARAVITIFGTGLLVGIGVHLLRAALSQTIFLLPTFAALTRTAADGLVVVGFGIGIARALWPSDDNPARQPLPFPESLGRRMRFYPVAGAVLLALVGFVEQASVLLHASPQSRSLAHAVTIVLDGGLILAFLVAVGRSRPALEADSESASFSFTALGWAALVLGLMAWLIGFPGFAVLLFQELIWASLVGVTALLLVRLLHALLEWLFGSKHAAGRFATRIVGLGRARVDQACILATGVTSFLVWLAAIGLMLAPLGGEGQALVNQIQPALLFGELRRLHIAPRAIATAILVLAVGIVLTRLLRRWLQNRFLPATALDVGVRSSIVTGISYAGILLALLAATQALGIALDRITLIASALSVGIGFGLQSIIQNFVSGVIVLIERPIQIGDWVAASGVEGTVRRVKVRATEIAMADGSIAIVPNSSFISANVQNRTAAGIAGRIDITIKLSGAGTPAEARDAILAAVTGMDRIDTHPAPKLLLTEAGQDSLSFVLQAYSNEKRATIEEKSELLFSLAERLNAAGMKAALS